MNGFGSFLSVRANHLPQYKLYLFPLEDLVIFLNFLVKLVIVFSMMMMMMIQRLEHNKSCIDPTELWQPTPLKPTISIKPNYSLALVVQTTFPNYHFFGHHFLNFKELTLFIFSKWLKRSLN